MSAVPRSAPTPLAERPAWRALVEHHKKIATLHLRDLFAADAGRGERLTLEAAGLYLDYSKNRITDETLTLLVNLAKECGLAERIAAMFNGEKINVTEDRAVLHVALRAPADERLLLDGTDVVPEVQAVLDAHGGLLRPGAQRRLARPQRPARSATSSTSASAGRTSGP